MRKSNLRFVFILFVITFLFSCNKGENYTVKGRIVEDCAGNIPVANKEFTFRSRFSGGVLSAHKSGLNITVTTNSNGEFQFCYNSKKMSNNDIYIYELFDTYNHSYDSPIKSKENADIGNFPIQNDFTFKVKLNVKNSYTLNDTLYLMGQNQNVLISIPGPFSNTTLGPFSYSARGNFYYIKNNLSQNIKMTVKSNIYTNGYQTNFYIKDKVKMCDQSEQLFELEIN